MTRDVNLTRTTITGAAWMSGASVVRVAIRMLAVAILARLVTPADFGIAAASLVVVDFAVMLGQLGLSSAIIQRKEILERHLATAFGTALLLLCFLVAGMWYAAPVFARLMAIEETTTITKVLTLMVVFRLIGGLAEAILARNLKSREIASASLISWTLAAFLVAIPLAFFGFGYWALVAMSIAEAGIWCVLLTRRTWETFPLPWIDLQSLRDLLPLGFGFAVMAPFSFLSTNVDRFLLARLMGASELGLYSRSAFLAKTGVKVFNGIIRTTAFPAMARVQNDEIRLQKAFRSGIALTALLAIPAGMFCALFAAELVAVLLGKQWGAAAFPLATFGVALYPILGQRFVVGFFQSIGRPYSLIPIQLVYIALLATTIIVLYRFGLSAVCAGIACVSFVQFFLSLGLTRQKAKVDFAQLMRLHRPPLLVASGVFVCGLAAKHSTVGFAPWMSLGLGVILVVLFLMLALRMAPAHILGQEGQNLAVKVLGSRARYLGSSFKSTG
ncbi:MAG: lipopolysaccharide biosynthesis protein [Pseudomonadota bacterium]